MSTAPSQKPTTVSLAYEEAVRRIVVDTIFGLWATEQSDPPAPIAGVSAIA
jgi:hypothetical protein